MCQNCIIKTCYEKVISLCLYISVLHLSNISFRTVQFFARSKRMKVENIYIYMYTGYPQIRIWTQNPTFKSVHICRGDFLKHILHDKNLSVPKYLHVKTTAKYAECVKTLMRGGDLLIESCGCILSLKSTSICSGFTSAQNNLCHTTSLPFSPKYFTPS